MKRQGHHQIYIQHTLIEGATLARKFALEETITVRWPVTRVKFGGSPCTASKLSAADPTRDRTVLALYPGGSV